MSSAPANRAPDAGDEERRRVADEIALRLRRRGVQLTGKESSDELADLEDAVEGFERAVERSGGDLMVDEPVSGTAPIEPDEADFVLPARAPSEATRAFIARINDAAQRAGQPDRQK